MDMLFPFLSMALDLIDATAGAVAIVALWHPQLLSRALAFSPVAALFGGRRGGSAVERFLVEARRARQQNGTRAPHRRPPMMAGSSGTNRLLTACSRRPRNQ